MQILLLGPELQPLIKVYVDALVTGISGRLMACLKLPPCLSLEIHRAMEVDLIASSILESMQYTC